MDELEGGEGWYFQWTCQVLLSEITTLNSEVENIPVLRAQFKQELESLKKSHDIMVDRLSEKLPMDEYHMKRGKVVEWHSSKRADVFKRYKEMDKQRETQEVLVETKLESLIGSAMVEWNAKKNPPEPEIDSFVSDLVAELENFLSLDAKQPSPEVSVEAAPTSGTIDTAVPRAWISLWCYKIYVNYTYVNHSFGPLNIFFNETLLANPNLAGLGCEEWQCSGQWCHLRGWDYSTGWSHDALAQTYMQLQPYYLFDSYFSSNN